MSKLESLRANLGLCLAFFFLASFFLGPFYWPGSSAGWANSLRITLVVALLAMFWRELPRIRLDAFQLLLVLFLCYLGANAVIVAEDAQAVRRLVFLLCFVFLVAMLDVRSRYWQILLGWSAVLGAGFALLSLINLYDSGRLFSAYRAGRLFSSGIPEVADFGNTIVAAMHYAVCFCAAMWLYFTARHRFALFCWACCATIIATYVILTYARSGWVACLVGALMLLIVLYRRERWMRSMFFLLGLLVLLAFFLYEYSGYELGVRGVTHRDEIWSVVISRGLSSWLWGHGACAALEPIIINEGRAVVRNAHSVYLEVFYQLGLIGLMMMVAVLVGALWRLARYCLAEKEGVASFALALLAAAAVVMSVEMNGFISTPNLVWQWFWLPLGIALGCRRSSNVAY